MRPQKWGTPLLSWLLPQNRGAAGFARRCPAALFARRWCCLFCRCCGAACEGVPGPGEHPARCCSASAPEHPTWGCKAKRLAPACRGIRGRIRPPTPPPKHIPWDVLPGYCGNGWILQPGGRRLLPGVRVRIRLRRVHQAALHGRFAYIIYHPFSHQAVLRHQAQAHLHPSSQPPR